jgi:hypothetical protein
VDAYRQARLHVDAAHAPVDLVVEQILNGMAALPRVAESGSEY